MLKKSKAEKNLRTFEESKSHNGQATDECIQNFEQLNATELLTEVKYLREAIAPSTRQISRIIVDEK